MTARYTREQVRATYKPRDAWWTVLLVDPLAGPLTRVVANRTSITPNQLTFTAAAIGLGAAWSFWTGTATGLVVGAGALFYGLVLAILQRRFQLSPELNDILGSLLPGRSESQPRPPQGNASA